VNDPSATSAARFRCNAARARCCVRICGLPYRGIRQSAGAGTGRPVRILEEAADYPIFRLQCESDWHVLEMALMIPLKTSEAPDAARHHVVTASARFAWPRSTGSPAGKAKTLAVLLTRHGPILGIECGAFDRQIKLRQMPTHGIGPIGGGQHLNQFD
jgi:hypothetical protein